MKEYTPVVYYVRGLQHGPLSLTLQPVASPTNNRTILFVDKDSGTIVITLEESISVLRAILEFVHWLSRDCQQPVDGCPAPPFDGFAAATFVAALERLMSFLGGLRNFETCSRLGPNSNNARDSYELPLLRGMSIGAAL
jgi:hypothetical protein